MVIHARLFSETEKLRAAAGIVFLLISGTSLSLCADAQTASGTILTLDEAISLARSKNRDLKQSGLEISKQREALNEAKTQFYPRLDTSLLAAQLLNPLDFTIQAGQFGTFPTTGPIPENNVNLHTPSRLVAIASATAIQPLTQLLRTRLSVAEQRVNIDSTQLSFQQNEQKLVDDVRRGYYEVLQAQSQLESQQSMVKYLEELQQLTDLRFTQRVVLESDRLSVKAELAKASYQVTVIQDGLADRKEYLNHLLGRDLQTDFSVETLPSILPEEQDLPAARKVALEHRPELKQSELMILRQCVSHQDRLGNNRTEPIAIPTPPNNNDDGMQKKSKNVAHSQDGTKRKKLKNSRVSGIRHPQVQ